MWLLEGLVVSMEQEVDCWWICIHWTSAAISFYLLKKKKICNIFSNTLIVLTNRQILLEIPQTGQNTSVLVSSTPHSGASVKRVSLGSAIFSLNPVQDRCPVCCQWEEPGTSTRRFILSVLHNYSPAGTVIPSCLSAQAIKGVCNA